MEPWEKKQGSALTDSNPVNPWEKKQGVSQPIEQLTTNNDNLTQKLLDRQNNVFAPTVLGNVSDKIMGQPSPDAGIISSLARGAIKDIAAAPETMGRAFVQGLGGIGDIATSAAKSILRNTQVKDALGDWNPAIGAVGKGIGAANNFVSDKIYQSMPQLLQSGVNTANEYINSNPALSADINTAAQIPNALMIKGLLPEISPVVDVVGQLAKKGIAQVGAGDLLNKIGESTTTSRWKPIKSIRENGFKPETITKYDLDANGATIPDVITTGQQVLNDSRQAVLDEYKKLGDNVKPENQVWDKELGAYTVQAPSIDPLIPIQEAREKFLKNNINSSKYATILDNLEQNIKSSFNLDGGVVGKIEDYRNSPVVIKNGELGLNDIDQIRQQYGRAGYFPKNTPLTPEMSAQEDVMNFLYDRTRKQIDDAVVNAPELQRLNKTMTEVIPIVNAGKHAIDRIANNEPMGLSDLTLGNLLGNAATIPEKIATSLLYKGAKSTPVGIGSMRVGQELNQFKDMSIPDILSNAKNPQSMSDAASFIQSNAGNLGVSPTKQPAINSLGLTPEQIQAILNMPRKQSIFNIQP